MRKKRIALFMVCLAVSLFCLTLSSCGDNFGTKMYADFYVVVPKEYIKVICTTKRNVDFDNLNQELKLIKFSEVCTYSLQDTISKTYKDGDYNIFWIEFEEQSFSSTETYVLDLQYMFYDKDENVTECSQNIVIPFENIYLDKSLPSEISDGHIYIHYSYTQSI